MFCSTEAISGFIAGASSSIVLHPFDNIKVRLQVHDGALPRDLLGKSNKPFSTVLFVRKILKEKGLPSMYQGVSANVLASSCTWGLYFYLYRYAKNKVLEDIPRHPNLSVFIASTLSGATCTLIMNPLWVLKTRAILDPLGKSYPSIALFLEIGSKSIRGYYAGLIPGLLASIHGGIYFLIYEKFKERRPLPLNLLHEDAQIASFSFCSKISATVCTYPLQLLRSRFQDLRGDTTGKMYDKGVWEAITRVYVREGFFGFYKGAFASLLKITPSSIITLVVYEKMITCLS